MKHLMAGTFALLLACAGTGPGETELAGTRWVLTELNGEAVTAVGEGNAGYLRFESENQAFAASAGCNGMGGKWHSGGSALGFSEVMSTLMACQEPLMTRERQLAEALHSTTTYRFAENRLELRAGQNVLAVFTSELAP